MKNSNVVKGQMDIFNFVEEFVNPHEANNRILEKFFEKKYGKQLAKDMMHCNIIQVRKNKVGRKIFVDHSYMNKQGVPAVYEMRGDARHRRFIDWIEFESSTF